MKNHLKSKIQQLWRGHLCSCSVVTQRRQEEICCVGWIRFAKTCHDVHLKLRWSRWGEMSSDERNSCHYRCRELCACLSTTWTLQLFRSLQWSFWGGEYWGTWSPVGKLVFTQGEMGDRGNKRLVYPIDPFDLRSKLSNWWVILSSQNSGVLLCVFLLPFWLWFYGPVGRHTWPHEAVSVCDIIGQGNNFSKLRYLRDFADLLWFVECHNLQNVSSKFQ